MTLNCNGQLIDLNTPKIMGILNLTPDSFYDGGKYIDVENALRKTEEMLLDGATFIDIGAFSSKPGAEEISEEEESRRLFPVLEKLVGEFPHALFSIDTCRSQIADESLKIGACMINDISGGKFDSKLMEVVGKHSAPYVLMHMKGSPKNMQDNPKYDDIIQEMLYYFSEKVQEAYGHGINDIIIDPGFGFGKNIDHNYELLKNLELFHALKLPLLVGISRKSMIYKKLNIKPQQALNGTSVLHSVALLKGAQILRVHDVKEAKECVDLLETLH